MLCLNGLSRDRLQQKQAAQPPHLPTPGCEQPLPSNTLPNPGLVQPPPLPAACSPPTPHYSSVQPLPPHIPRTPPHSGHAAPPAPSPWRILAAVPCLRQPLAPSALGSLICPLHSLLHKPRPLLSPHCLKCHTPHGTQATPPWCITHVFGTLMLPIRKA